MFDPVVGNYVCYSDARSKPASKRSANINDAGEGGVYKYSKACRRKNAARFLLRIITRYVRFKRIIQLISTF
jgi:hypothetical protein